MDNFRRFAGEASKAPPVVAETPVVVGTGSDSGQFETPVPPADAAAVAAGIISAGEKRRGKFDGFS
jgi:hypothetical protein